MDRKKNFWYKKISLHVHTKFLPCFLDALPFWLLHHLPLLIGRTDAEAETPILWPPDAKNWLIGKDPDAGKD